MSLNDSIPRKECSKCGETKPLTSEYFNPQNTCKDGFRPECRECHKAYCKARYWVDPETNRQIKRDDYQSDPEKFRAKSRKFRAENPDIVKQQNKEWRETHQDEFKEYHREWSHRNADKIKGYREDERARDIDRVRARGRKTYYNNKPRYFHHSRLRRARMKGAEGTYTPDDIRRIYDETEGRCAYCGITLSWDIPGDIHIDHIQPLSRGGSNWPVNLACACADCNLSKNDKLLSEWVQVRGW